MKNIPIKRVVAKPKSRESLDNIDLLLQRQSSNHVFKIVSILSKQIGPEYHQKSRDFHLLRIHKEPGSKYFILFTQIYDFLLELKGNYGNPIEYLIRDYLRCIYSYYSQYRRLPNLNQLRPYTTNQVHFHEWICEWERYREEDYFMIENPGTPKEIEERARKAIEDGKVDLMLCSLDEVSIVEVGRGSI